MILMLMVSSLGSDDGYDDGVLVDRDHDHGGQDDHIPGRPYYGHDKR